MAGNTFSDFTPYQAPQETDNAFSDFEPIVTTGTQGQPRILITKGTGPVASSQLPAAIADIPKEIKGAFNENLEALKNSYLKADPSGSLWEQYKATGQGLLAIPGMAASPITGAVRSVAGHTIADTVQGLGGRLDNNVTGPQETPEQAYQEAKDRADQLTLLAGTVGRPVGGVRPAPPSNVLLSTGQETGDVNLLRQEQSARRNLLGDKAYKQATQFDVQQTGQVQDLSTRIGQSFDAVGGQTLAENPQAAAAMAQTGLQRARNIEKAAVDAKYSAAKGAGGEVDANVFRGMGGDLRSDITNRPDAVFVDDKLTPWANEALKEVDRAQEFRGGLQPASSPNAPPNPASVRGVSLEGVDQVRKRLVQFRSNAWKNSEADGRAAGAVIDAFDNRIDQAVNSGAFNGNPAAVQDWNEARAASSAFKQKFSGNDPVGTKVRNILGRNDRDPLTPNDVADALYGASGTNPSSVNVGVANRVKTVLGENSPEWSAVKQGLWSRLTERGAGQTEMGPGMIANRISKFLNADGKEMAETVFSPQERGLINQFGQLQRKLELPKGTFNSSETSTFVNKALSGIGRKVTFMIGMKLAEHFGFGAVGEIVGGVAAEKGTEAVSGMTSGGQIVKQMPLVNQAVDKWTKAVRAYDRANSAPSRIALSVATSNLGRQLGHVGISLKDLLPGGTQQQDQNQKGTPPVGGQ